MRAHPKRQVSPWRAVKSSGDDGGCGDGGGPSSTVEGCRDAEDGGEPWTAWSAGRAVEYSVF
ncbi:hypothetical protein RvY_02917 [Ramazzottius varieornatus]|uniref:Uncharacterized protein n=1 Tax=Ramazzottius varieornatus TaxID=947166 RepID=A0A1D1UM49_RAMVA|nr:hypothetical protein RvY_02917 [Ramazzottius varieornatus]